METYLAHLYAKVGPIIMRFYFWHIAQIFYFQRVWLPPPSHTFFCCKNHVQNIIRNFYFKIVRLAPTTHTFFCFEKPCAIICHILFFCTVCKLPIHRTPWKDCIQFCWRLQLGFKWPDLYLCYHQNYLRNFDGHGCMWTYINSKNRKY